MHGDEPAVLLAAVPDVEGEIGRVSQRRRKVPSGKCWVSGYECAGREFLRGMRESVGVAFVDGRGVLLDQEAVIE